MIAKFFFRKTEAMVLIWNLPKSPHPHPQTHVSLLKSSSLSWIERGTNGEGRLIQERCQWEPGPAELWGGHGANPAWGCAHPAPAEPAGQGDRGHSGKPPRDCPGCAPRAKAKGHSPAEAALGGVWDITQGESAALSSFRRSGIASAGTGFALPEESYLIFPSFPSLPPALCQGSLDLNSPSNLVFPDELFLLLLFTQFFSLI